MSFVEICDTLTSGGYMDKVYEALQSDDLSNGVMEIVDVLRETDKMRKYKK